jgi:hypothetical protein
MATIIALSGQVSVTSAGKAVRFTSTFPGTYLIKPMSTNTGLIWVGNDGSSTGDVTSSNGFELKKDVDKIIVTVTNMNQIWMDATTTGDGACFFKIMAECAGNTPPAA